MCHPLCVTTVFNNTDDYSYHMVWMKICPLHSPTLLSLLPTGQHSVEGPTGQVSALPLSPPEVIQERAVSSSHLRGQPEQLPPGQRGATETESSSSCWQKPSCSVLPSQEGPTVSGVCARVRVHACVCVCVCVYVCV